jgi:hypothetical protein
MGSLKAAPPSNISGLGWIGPKGKKCRHWEKSLRNRRRIEYYGRMLYKKSRLKSQGESCLLFGFGLDGDGTVVKTHNLTG